CPLATVEFGNPTLAALCGGIGDHHPRLAIRLVPRLVDGVLLSRTDADAGFGKPRGREANRRPAPGDGMELAGGDRPPRRGGARPPLHLSRPHHAADAGGIEHDPEKWKPVFRKRSCSNKRMTLEPDSIQLNQALAGFS